MNNTAADLPKTVFKLSMLARAGDEYLLSW